MLQTTPAGFFLYGVHIQVELLGCNVCASSTLLGCDNVSLYFHMQCVFPLVLGIRVQNLKVFFQSHFCFNLYFSNAIDNLFMFIDHSFFCKMFTQVFCLFFFFDCSFFRTDLKKFVVFWIILLLVLFLLQISPLNLWLNITLCFRYLLQYRHFYCQIIQFIICRLCVSIRK